MNDTLNILKREALLKLGIGWEDAVDACESIAEVETLLRLVLGRKGNVWEDVSPTHVTKTHNSVRVIRRHTYTRV